MKIRTAYHAPLPRPLSTPARSVQRNAAASKTSFVTRTLAVATLSLGLGGCYGNRATEKQIIGQTPEPWVNPTLGTEARWMRLPSEITERRITDLETLRHNDPCFKINGPFGEIDYFRAGPKDSPYTLVFWPGIPGLAYDYHAPTIDLAKMGFDVISVSPPGLGHSSRNKEVFRYTLDDYARMYRWFVQSMDLKNVIFVVNSFSAVTGPHTICRYGQEDLSLKGMIVYDAVSWGIVTDEYTIPQSERLTGTTFFGPLGLFAMNRVPWMGLDSEYDHQFRHLTEEQKAFFLTEYHKHWYTGSIAGLFIEPSEVQDIHEAIRGQNLVYENRAAYHELLAPHFDRLKGLPILYISAGDDEVSPRPYSQKIFGALSDLTANPHNRFVPIEGVGHMTVMLKPEAVQQTTSETAAWLRSLQNP